MNKHILPKWSFICLLFLSLYNKSTAQNQTTDQANSFTEISTKSISIADPGTFYVIPTRKRKQMFTEQDHTELRMIAAENRKLNKEVRMSINRYTDIVILPTSKIEHPDFTPYRTLYIND